MTRKLLKTLGLTAALVLALTGCMKMDMNLELQSDDTVNGSVVFGVSHALVELSGEDPDTIVEQMQGELLGADGELGEVTTEAFSDDDFVGTTTHFKGAALDAFSSGEEDALSIVRDGDDFVVTGAMDLAGEETEQLGAMMSGFDINIAITFPGEVTDHNGELDGRTVVWTPKIGERLDISARGAATEGGAGGLPMAALIGIAIGGLAVIAIVLLLLVRNRGRQGAADAGAGTEGFAAPAPAGDPLGTQFEPGAPATSAAPLAGAPETGVPPVVPPPVDVAPTEATLPESPEAPGTSDEPNPPTTPAV